MLLLLMYRALSLRSRKLRCDGPRHISAYVLSLSRWVKLLCVLSYVAQFKTFLMLKIFSVLQKPPLKREDSFLKRFSSRQIPEAQETVEDTGSEGGTTGDPRSAPRRRRRQRKQPKTVVNPDENFYFYWLLALTVCVLYNLWTLIVRQSFPEFQVGFHVCIKPISYNNSHKGLLLKHNIIQKQKIIQICHAKPYACVRA